MTDNEIIELFNSRNETAIRETAKLYGSKLNKLAFKILKNNEDSEECVSDTYLKVWNSIPPQKPVYFYAYISKICRYLCFGKLDYKNAKKRNGEVVSLSDELMVCIPDKMAEREYEENIIGEILSAFLNTLSEESRLIFMRRYWFLDSIAYIANLYNISESKVKTSLCRTRKKLKTYLEKEDIIL